MPQVCSSCDDLTGLNLVKFSFAFVSRPIPTIKWKKRSKAGGPDEVVAIDNNDPNSPFKSFSFGRTLVLHKAKKSEHEGIYTCEAQSSGGTITQETSVTIHGKLLRRCIRDSSWHIIAVPPTKNTKEAVMCC